MQAMESQEDEAAVGVDQKEIQKLSEVNLFTGSIKKTELYNSRSGANFRK